MTKKSDGCQRVYTINKKKKEEKPLECGVHFTKKKFRNTFSMKILFYKHRNDIYN